MNSGIDYRHFYLEDAPDREEGSDRLHQRYLHGAMKTGCQAILGCGNSPGTTVGDVGFLSVCTCTGYVCPDVGGRLVAHMAFRNLQRVSIVGLRCAGALPALQRTVDFVRANPGRQALQTAWRSELDSNPRYGFGSLRPLSVRKLQRAKLWQRISYQNLTLTLCKQSDLDSPSVRIEKLNAGDCVVESGQLGTSLMAKPATSDSTSAQDSEFVSAGWVYAQLMTSEWATIRSEPFFHLCPRRPVCRGQSIGMFSTFVRDTGNAWRRSILEQISQCGQ